VRDDGGDLVKDDLVRETLRRRILALIDRLADGSRDDQARDELLADLVAWQERHIPAFARLRRARPHAALPTDVFRHARVASHPPKQDVRLFRSSGTTSGARSTHAFRDLSLYDAAARSWARTLFFAQAPRRMVALVPPETEAPDSSLSYMIARFGDWFGELHHAWQGGRLAPDLLEAALSRDEPVTLLGTSFAFVFADEVASRRFQLPEGSCIMQTGGFKGRTRTLGPAQMLTLLEERYGVPPERVVAEYSMTELSSQAWETSLVEPQGPRRLRFPGWVRVSLVDPETLEPTTGEGLLRIDDAANLDSVCAIQTSDLARLDGDGVTLLGRAPGAVPRGCSLAIEEALP